MKRLILLLLIIIALVASGFFYFKDNSQYEEDNTTTGPKGQEIDGVVYYNDEGDGIYLTKFNKVISLFYDPDAQQPIQEVAKSNNFTIAVNGSYFLDNNSPAGLLIQNGRKISPLAIDDSQVTHVVVFQEGLIKIFEAQSFNAANYLNTNVDAIQTGPLVINQNQIEADFINNSQNGTGRFARTLVGYTEDNEAFFIVTTKTYTLSELAGKVLNFDIFKGETITVVNLDGGSSTAMYSEKLKDFNITPNKKLPIVIGVE